MQCGSQGTQAEPQGPPSIPLQRGLLKCYLFISASRIKNTALREGSSQHKQDFLWGLEELACALPHRRPNQGSRSGGGCPRSQKERTGVCKSEKQDVGHPTSSPSEVEEIRLAIGKERWLPPSLKASERRKKQGPHWWPSGWALATLESETWDSRSTSSGN